MPATTFLTDPTPDALAAHARAAAPDEAAVVFLGDAHAEAFPAFAEACAATGAPVAGGLFPRVLARATQHARGALVLTAPRLGPPLGFDLHAEGAGWAAPLGRLADALGRATVATPTVLVLVDGLAAGVGPFLHALNDALGAQRATCLGGGAGRLSLTPGPCLFADEGAVRADAAVVVPLDVDARLGVQHGWTRLAGPLVATRTRGHVIEHLNWEPAFDVYRALVAEASGHAIDRAAFFASASRFPFSLYREGREDVVRDPVAVTDDGGLVCVGPVPEHAVLHVVHGTPPTLVAAARQASDGAREAGAVPDAVFVTDCVSRALYLGDSFDDEVGALEAPWHEAGVSAYGVLTLGEVASVGGGYLEWLNKTSVVAALRGPEV